MHAFRGAVTAWLALIALQAVASSGTGPIASALAGINGLVQRALDPAVPAVPDRRAGTVTGTAAGYTTPADLLPTHPIGSQPIPPRNLR